MSISEKYDGVDENLSRCAEMLFPYDAELHMTQISTRELKISYEGKIYIYDWLLNLKVLFDPSTEEGWCREFSRRVKHHMVRNQLNQSDLGRKLHASQPVVSKYLTGKARPSIPTLVRLSRVLGCSLDYLVGF